MKLRRRRCFELEFGRPWTGENMAALSPDEAARWQQISNDQYHRGWVRWVAIAAGLFHYPTTTILKPIFRRTQFPPGELFFVSGIIYLPPLYFLLRH